ncbi:MAG TPA: bifunctional transaldolase/phosoglucose isomerase [Solirubrobacteraceae bacterium]|jgi:transaldolase/glucose-6-phosphate isomerase|nr:bifunctional transaldolase/phosoglucose isomerase [Solirubrobacteraceae bacterium]
MSVQAQVNPRLAALTEAGTSVWLDQIRRNLIEDGELQRLIDEDSLRGVTSNPAIFEKAILGSDDYDEDLVTLAKEGLDKREIYRHIAAKDVQLAADVLRPLHDRLNGLDGFVSIEVAPRLAHDTAATLEQVHMYWERVDRPNLMVKIPGTEEGVPAIEQALYEGININITLLFSVERYAAVAEAYVRALERRLDEGKSVDVRSVASFFVSRVDTEVDKRLEKLGRGDLQGTAAVANARAAYQRFKQIFEGERFARLREAGAAVQRPLWASTGVKNPHYSETKYVDELVAPHTVNTMPMPTLFAVAERGEVRGATADQDPSGELEALAEGGIDLDDVTDKLLRDGIDAFQVAIDKLIAGVEDRREAVVTGRPPTVRSVMPDELEPAVAETAKRAVADDVAKRIWHKDDTLWGEAGAPEVADRLGWLTISEPMLEDAADLRAFAEACQADGLTDAVLLGMGGSSLGPEVIRRTFGEIEGAMRLQVLDSTDPAAVLAVERSVDLSRTLFVVSSKSGGTIETLSHFRYFHDKVAQQVGDEAGSRFVAVTDPGSPLVELAHEHGFRRVFENDPDIGGRYSVLSYFGLVPAALMGVAIEALLNRCQVAEQNCTSYDQGTSNSGLWLGIVMGALARHGRDKLSFLVSEPISSFGLWVEQLIAESLGKDGKGVVPVADEPLGPPEAYGEDRTFAYLRNADDPDAELDAATDALGRAGQPVITMSVHGPTDLGRIFFFAEFATAVAGWVLGVNAFNQPNVQEAKDNTAKVLERYASDGALPEVADADDAALARLLDGAAPPNYVAIMGYLPPSARFDQAVAKLREAIRDRTRCATTFGYGPRFLHSTGQLHKGGLPTGIFLQLVHDGDEDAEIPGAGYTFGTLKHAQATGDLQTLRDHGLPAERVPLEGDPADAVRQLTDKIKEL